VPRTTLESLHDARAVIYIAAGDLGTQPDGASSSNRHPEPHHRRKHTSTMAETALAPDICVAPLSSPFSLLPRAHTYALAATLLLPLPRGWLFRAALAAFATRTALFAVDAAVLLAQLRRDAAAPVPLDALVALEALGLAAALACWLLLVARRETAARPLVRAWAAAVGVGGALAFAAVARLGQLVESPGVGPGGVCQEVLMRRDELFGAVEVVPVLGPMGTRTAWFARRVGVPGLLCASLSMLAALIAQQSTGARVEGDVEEGDVTREKSGPWAHLKWAVSLAGWALTLLLPAMAIFIVVSTEQFLFQMVPTLPSLEHTSSVGQWGVWAATGVVLTATFINASREHAGLEKPSVGVENGSEKADTEVKY